MALAATAAGIRVFEARRPDGIPAVDLAIDWRVAMFAVTTEPPLPPVHRSGS